jgi:hypothetical protein
MSAKTIVDVSKGFVNAEIPVRDSYGIERRVHVSVLQTEGERLITVEEATRLVTQAVEQALRVDIKDQ